MARNRGRGGQQQQQTPKQKPFLVLNLLKKDEQTRKVDVKAELYNSAAERMVRFTWEGYVSKDSTKTTDNKVAEHTFEIPTGMVSVLLRAEVVDDKSVSDQLPVRFEMKKDIILTLRVLEKNEPKREVRVSAELTNSPDEKEIEFLCDGRSEKNNARVTSGKKTEYTFRIPQEANSPTLRAELTSNPDIHDQIQISFALKDKVEEIKRSSPIDISGPAGAQKSFYINVKTKEPHSPVQFSSSEELTVDAGGRKPKTGTSFQFETGDDAGLAMTISLVEEDAILVFRVDGQNFKRMIIK